MRSYRDRHPRNRAYDQVSMYGVISSNGTMTGSAGDLGDLFHESSTAKDA